MSKTKYAFSLVRDVIFILIALLVVIEFILILRFKDTADGVMTKLRSLNNSVLADLPHPPGVTLVNQNSILLGPENYPAHRTYTSLSEARYRLNGTSPGFIADYYKNFFSSRGWQQDWQKDGLEVNGNYSYGFHQGTTCVALNFTSQDFTFDLGSFSSFTLSVWHDFGEQAFGPLNLFGITEFIVKLRYSLPTCPRSIT